MRNWAELVRGHLALAILTGMVLIPDGVWAWDAHVHPKLNELAVEMSQKGEENQAIFYSEIVDFKQELIDGGLDEDENVEKPGKYRYWLNGRRGFLEETHNCIQGREHPKEKDGPLYPRSRKHFYHPYAKVGLSDEIIFREPEHGRCLDAVSWARDDEGQGLTWTGAMEAYGYGHKSKDDAYFRVGHVAHLIGDMSQPDHVHLEPHSLAGDPVFGFKTYFDGLDKYAINNWDVGDRVNPKLDVDYPGRPKSEYDDLLPIRYLTMEEHLKELAQFTYEFSQYASSLTTKKPYANNTLAAMFDVDYDGFPAYQWDLLNKKGFRNLNPLDNIGDWDGDYSEDDEWYAPGALPLMNGWIERKQLYFIEVNDGGNEDAVPAKFRVPQDPDWTFQPNLTGWTLVDNTAKWSLRRLYTNRLLPLAAQHIAGAYMFFFDIVNHPPILSSVQVNQGDTTVYDRTWKPIVLGDDCPKATIEGRELKPARPPTEWINGSGKAAAVRLSFGGGYRGTSNPPDPSIRCHTAEPKNMGEVAVVIGGIEVIGALLLNGSTWEGDIIPPMDGSLDGRHPLQVTGKDREPHWAAYVNGSEIIYERNFPGDELDSEPDSLALAEEIVPYNWIQEKFIHPDEWSEYPRHYVPGADMNHVLLIDATSPTLTEISNERDDQGQTVAVYEARDVTSGLEDVETIMVGHAMADVDPFDVGTTDPVRVTITSADPTLSEFGSVELTDVAKNSSTHTVLAPPNPETPNPETPNAETPNPETPNNPFNRGEFGGGGGDGVLAFGVIELMCGFLFFIFRRFRSLSGAARQGVTPWSSNRRTTRSAT